MKRIEAASGAKYSSHNEPTRRFEPIAPVGTNYTPVGKVDIAALKKAPPPAAKPALPTSSRPVFGAPAASAGSLYGKAAAPPSNAWPEEKAMPTSTPASPPPPRPPTLPTTGRPAFSAISPTRPSAPAFSALSPVISPPPSQLSRLAVSNVPTKPAEEDRIEPNKSSWTPVSLPPPRKLKNPFAAMEQQSLAQQSSPSQLSATNAKKLTWSERQALAKKQAEEEEVKSRSASFVPPTPVSKTVFKSSAPAFGRATVSQSAPKNFGSVPAAAGAGIATGVTTTFSARATSPPVPAPPPPPPAATRPIIEQPAVEEEPDAEVSNFTRYRITTYSSNFIPSLRLLLLRLLYPLLLSLQNLDPNVRLLLLLLLHHHPRRRRRRRRHPLLLPQSPNPNLRLRLLLRLLLPHRRLHHLSQQ